jgi:hypothetical protein
MHERHLRIPNRGPIDVNREAHLKHPAYSAASIKQYRQQINVFGTKTQGFWSQLIKQISNIKLF